MRPAGLPPGPSYPSAIQMIGYWTRPVAFVRECRKRYGKRFTIRPPLAPPFVMLTDPAEVKDVLTAPPDVLHPGKGARVLEPIVGSNSVLLLDESAHMEQRKLMLPAFHGERMELLTSLMEQVTTEELASLPRETPVVLHPHMQDLTLRIILRAVFGLDPGPRFEMLRERLKAMLAFGDKPISLLLPTEDSLVTKIVRPFAHFARMKAEVDRVLFELIRERRNGGAERNDVLSTLLEARHEDGSPMSEQEVRDELMTLLLAGHETTASTLAWIFERLAHLPQALARLIERIDADDDAYLTATIQEALRVRPVLPTPLPRFVVKPVEIGGWTYQPGCCLVLCGYLIHHDPEIYPEPNVFRPERFLDEPPGTYTWLPFGGGRRRCLGASFAMTEMKIVLRSTLRALTLHPGSEGPEMIRRRNITITPSRGAQVILADRQPVPIAA